jgi:2-oxoglutarate dehydrogenase E1 component
MERFLQLCDDNPFVFPESSPEKSRQMQDCNMQVVYCSTPANYFHALRRQVHRDFRKPLIVLTSKSLLRHPMCKSSLNDMAAGTQFQRLINETDPEIVNGGSKVKKVIFCSGQVYYALAKTREANNMKDIAIARVEQISPFPYQKVLETADQFPEAEIVWAQEEPLNNGAWTYVEPRIETALTKSKFHAGKRIKYAGRDPSGSVATGNKKQHEKEELNLLSKALVGEIRKPTKVSHDLSLSFNLLVCEWFANLGLEK